MYVLTGVLRNSVIAILLSLPKILSTRQERSRAITLPDHNLFRFCYSFHASGLGCYVSFLRPLWSYCVSPTLNFLTKARHYCKCRHTKQLVHSYQSVTAAVLTAINSVSSYRMCQMSGKDSATKTTKFTFYFAC
jgi:hypothetical protein